MAQSMSARVFEVMAYLKDYISAIKAGRSHPFSTVERKTRAATRNERWGPSGTMLNELAELSFDEEAVQIIFAVLEYRMKLPPARWQNVYKALLVLHFLLTRGSQRAVTLAHLLALQLSSLAHFKHVDAAGIDCGQNVQHRSQVLRELLADPASLDVERQRYMVNKTRQAAAVTSTGQSPVRSQDRARSLPGSPFPMDVGGRSVIGPQNIPTYSPNAKAAVTPVEAKLNLDDLQKLLLLQSNRTCADCQSTTTAARPSWASINTGTFLCMRCAGIHRGLGVHVSQVRSCSLDTWLRDQVEFMAATGNATANSHWEATLDPAANLRPPRDSPALEKFIRLKYCEKSWVASSSTWPPANAPASPPTASTAAALSGVTRVASAGSNTAGVASATAFQQAAAPATSTTGVAILGVAGSMWTSSTTPPRFSRVSAPQQSQSPWVSHNNPLPFVNCDPSTSALKPTININPQQQQQQQQQEHRSMVNAPSTMDLLQLDSDEGEDHLHAPESHHDVEILGFSLPNNIPQTGRLDPFQLHHRPSQQPHHHQHHHSISADDHLIDVDRCHAKLPDTSNSVSGHSHTIDNSHALPSPTALYHSLDPFHASNRFLHQSSPPTRGSTNAGQPTQHRPVQSISLPQTPAPSYEWQDFNSTSDSTSAAATSTSAPMSTSAAAAVEAAAATLSLGTTTSCSRVNAKFANLTETVQHLTASQDLKTAATYHTAQCLSSLPVTLNLLQQGSHRNFQQQQQQQQQQQNQAGIDPLMQQQLTGFDAFVAAPWVPPRRMSHS